MDEVEARQLPVSLTGQFKRHMPRYLVGVVLLALYQYGQYWFDTRLMRAINAATAGEQEIALRLGAMLIGVAVLTFGIRVLSRVAMFYAGRNAEYELRTALLARLQRLGPTFYQKMPVGEIMSRVTNDLAQVRLLLGFGILNAVNTVFGLISAFSVTIGISPVLTLAALSPLPLLVLVTRKFSSQIYTRQKANQEALGEMSDLVQTSIAGSRVIRAFALEESQIERFSRTNDNYLDKSLSLARLRGSLGPVMQSLTGLGMVIVFWYGGHLLVTGAIDEGGFLAFFRALGRLSWPLMALGFLVGLLQRGRAAYGRLVPIFQAEPEIQDGHLPAPASTEGSIEVRNLTFAYGDDSAVLRNVSFHLPSGRSIAIVGRTGSGKSTLARLLPRLEKTPAGSIFIDGRDICDLPLSYVRSVIGYAQQDPFLFSTTVGYNIGFSLDRPDAPNARELIVGAARRAHILDELLGLPDGLDTVVGERGVQLSGGQKQRVALASAFVLGPKVLVLDDPMSAVDSKTEHGILEAIDEQRAERGVILITHRIAAAKRCDHILVLDAGAIVEQGTHEELAQAGGIYASFADEQRVESELLALSEQSRAVRSSEAEEARFDQPGGPGK